jgi:hypothetical protein
VTGHNRGDDLYVLVRTVRSAPCTSFAIMSHAQFMNTAAFSRGPLGHDALRIYAGHFDLRASYIDPLCCPSKRGSDEPVTAVWSVMWVGSELRVRLRQGAYASMAPREIMNADRSWIRDR